MDFIRGRAKRNNAVNPGDLIIVKSRVILYNDDDKKIGMLGHNHLGMIIAMAVSPWKNAVFAVWSGGICGWLDADKVELL